MSTDSQLWAPSLRRGSVSDLIAQRILEMISSERLRPGDRLPSERELAVLLGASRPSLREAFRSLRAQGYVDIRHGSGVFVADPATTSSLQAAVRDEQMSLAELFDMREVIELPAAAWAACNHNAQRLDRVTEAYETLTAANLVPGIAWRRLQELDAAFHMRIVEAAGNRFLIRTLGVLQEMLARGMETTLQIPGRLEKSRRDHKRILDALLAADPTAARRAAGAHIRGVRRAAHMRVQNI